MKKLVQSELFNKVLKVMPDIAKYHNAGNIASIVRQNTDADARVLVNEPGLSLVYVTSPTSIEGEGVFVVRSLEGDGKTRHKLIEQNPFFVDYPTGGYHE